MTQESNGNDKLKEWGEVKIIENEYICKNLIHLVLQNIFLVLLWTYFAQCLPVFTTEFQQVNTGWKG